MADAYKCDRCGTLYEGAPHAGVIDWTLDGSRQSRPKPALDGSDIDELCASCYRQLEKFKDGELTANRRTR